MISQSFSLIAQNDDWLRDPAENIGDYATKSELVNDPVRRAHRAEVINRKLDLAEQSGFTEQSSESMLAEFKASIERDVR